MPATQFRIQQPPAGQCPAGRLHPLTPATSYLTKTILGYLYHASHCLLPHGLPITMPAYHSLIPPNGTLNWAYEFIVLDGRQNRRAYKRAVLPRWAFSPTCGASDAGHAADKQRVGALTAVSAQACAVAGLPLHLTFLSALPPSPGRQRKLLGHKYAASQTFPAHRCLRLPISVLFGHRRLPQVSFSSWLQPDSWLTDVLGLTSGNLTSRWFLHC